MRVQGPEPVAGADLLTRLPAAREVADRDLLDGAAAGEETAATHASASSASIMGTYWREPRVPITICRFFTTVGPREMGRYAMVVPTFVTQALRAEPVTVFGTRAQTGCFAHIKDVVACVVRLICAPGAVAEVHNIRTDEEVSMNQLAEVVRSHDREPVTHRPDLTRSSVHGRVPGDAAGGWWSIARCSSDHSASNRRRASRPSSPTLSRTKGAASVGSADQRARSGSNAAGRGARG
jgi:nucleoside-diphosphate-sugar epimerase